MNSYLWIMYAAIAVWAVLGLYLCLLARKQAKLAERIEQMSSLMEKQA